MTFSSVMKQSKDLFFYLNANVNEKWQHPHYVDKQFPFNPN